VRLLSFWEHLPKTRETKPPLFITFLNKARLTLSRRSSKKIPAPDTWESLEFNLDVGSITLYLVPQLFMLELMAAWCLPATTWIWQVRAHRIHHALHISNFFIFLVCYMLGEAKVSSQCWLRMLCEEQVRVSSKINYPIHAADPYIPASKNPRAPEMVPIHARIISNNHHSYWITTAHLRWFCGCLYPQSTGAHGDFALAPFEKSQLIQLLSKKEIFNSISSQTLASTCWIFFLKNSSVLDMCIPYTGVYGMVHLIVKRTVLLVT
jgi:hypothetical protein